MRLIPWIRDGEEAGARYVMAAPRVAVHGRTGAHQGVAPGASLEFSDHRDYQPGDDLRWLDWNASARTDRLIVKLYREEVSPHLDLIVDGSRSMALEGTVKAQATVGLACLMATAAANAGWTCRSWVTGDGCAEMTGGPGRPEGWTTPVLGASTNPGEAIVRQPPHLRPRSIRVLLSDLLWPGGPADSLRRLAPAAASLVVVQLLSAADREPPVEDNLRLVDCETGASLDVLCTPATAARYRDALADHLLAWERGARSHGALLATVDADSLVESWQPASLLEAGVLAVLP